MAARTKTRDFPFLSGVTYIRLQSGVLLGVRYPQRAQRGHLLKYSGEGQVFVSYNWFFIQDGEHLAVVKRHHQFGLNKKYRCRS